jgi:hypothetical protein
VANATILADYTFKPVICKKVSTMKQCITRFTLLIATCVALIACAGTSTPPPTIVVTATLLPTATTAPEPTATQGSVAVATALPTETPAPTVTLAPTGTPEGQIGPDNYPADVNPLTGLVVADPTKLDRRPLAIKVSNYPDCVRPQSGLSLADIVFQHYAEGPTTRFTAIFYTNDAPRVGSVRSARLIDLEIPAMYQTLFAFSGSSPGVQEKLRAIDFIDRVITPDFEPGHFAFFRVPIEGLSPGCQVLEHSLFTSTDRLWEDAEAKGINQRPNITGAVFNATPPSGGQVATTVSLAYDSEYVRWNYSDGGGTYFRYSAGGGAFDILTNTQISAANVVVLFAHHETTLILENLSGYDPATGKGGGRSIEIQLWGSGPGIIFRDGQAFNVTWTRPQREGAIGLVDGNGNPVPLKPGNTWFQLVNINSPVTFGEQNSWEIKPLRPTPVP